MGNVQWITLAKPMTVQKFLEYMEMLPFIFFFQNSSLRS